MSTDNTMRKPQHAWWKSIDNSYNPFITNLKSKPNGKYEISDEIKLAQRTRNMEIKRGGHKA